MSSKRARKHILTYQKETEASAKRKKFSAKPCACLDIELTAYLHEQDTLHTLLMLIEAQLTQTPNCLALRSEEHTSELQSRFDLVCRLLPEKNKRLKPSKHR